MNLETRQHLHKAYLVRTVEENLLQLFAAGKLSGTTHTCIGQEMSAVALAAALDRRKDVLVSNHRCHGHYLAWTDDPDGLLAEVMGKATGVCGGLGGSQVFGMAEEGVDYSQSNPEQLTSDIVEQLDEFKAQIIDGTIVVPDTPS